MSLINEALKKAQKQRSGEPLPAAEPEALPIEKKPVRRAPAASAQSVMRLLLIGAVCLLIMGSFLAYVFLYEDPPPPPIAIRPVVKPKVEPAVTAPLVIDQPVVIQPVQKPVQKPVELVITAPQANPAVYAYLETLKVTGIRASITDPKVLMNDRLYRLNDLVDRDLGLRLTRIELNGLTFTDITGYEYVKGF